MSRKTKEEVLEEFRCGSIQDAVMSVIARKGIEEMTIQDVADEAGIAKGTIYLYFRDREELLAKTADRGFETLSESLEPAFNATGPFADRLRALTLAQLRFFDAHGALYRTTLALLQRDTDLHKPRTRCSSQYAARLDKMFADAAASGEMRDLDPLAVAAVYRDCLRGVILRRLDPRTTRTRKSVEADAEFVASILLRGIQSGDKR